MTIDSGYHPAEGEKLRAEAIIRKIRKTVMCSIAKEKNSEQVSPFKCLTERDPSVRVVK
jgi:hypothetical protein